MQIAPRAARGGGAALCATAALKGGILFPLRIPPFEPPEKGEGRPPRPPTLQALGLKDCTRCAVQVRCTWLRHELSANRYRYQPRPTPWGASDVSSAADCGAGGGIASLATAGGIAALLRSPPKKQKATDQRRRLSDKFNNIIWGAVNQLAELFKCQHRDVLSLFQRIQGLIVKPILQQIILRNTFFLQRLPQRLVTDDCPHPTFLRAYYMESDEKQILCISPQYDKLPSRRDAQ